MSDAYHHLHGGAFQDWRDERADAFTQSQREAFLAGFEAAANEAKQFRLLREWLEQQRDLAEFRYEEHDAHGDFVRRMCFKDVLVKLSEIGCTPEADSA